MQRQFLVVAMILISATLTHAAEPGSRKVDKLRPRGMPVFSPTEPLLAVPAALETDSKHHIAYIDPATGEILRESTIEERHQDVRSLAFSPDGKLLAAGYATGVVQIWDTKTATIRRMLTDPRDSVRTLAFTPDGKTLAIGTISRFFIWEITQKNAQMIHSKGAACIGFNADGTLLASADNYGDAKIWDLKAGKPVGAARRIKTNPDAWGAMSPDRKQFAVGHGEGFNLLDTAGTAAPKPVPAKGGVTGMAFSPSGRYLAGAGPAYDITIWDLKTLKPQTIGTHQSSAAGVAWSADGKFVASAETDTVLMLWDVSKIPGTANAPAPKPPAATPGKK